MIMDYEFQNPNNFNINDIDFSHLRLNSPPYDYSLSSSVSNEISPLKRSSPESDDSDQPKRRKISPQNPILNTYPETNSSSIDEKQETTPSPSIKTRDTQSMKMEERNREATKHDFEKQREEEEEDDCGEGMRIERSGDGFVIRLKCKCRQAFRVLFSDHHLYFKPL